MGSNPRTETDGEIDRERLVEIGWLLVGAMTPASRATVDSARRAFVESLERELPAFDWKAPLVEDAEPLESPVEPVILLQRALEERARRHWDFVLVVTAAELVSHYEPFALATPSRAAGAAAISLRRLDASTTPETASRLERLAMHLLGDLSGLDHRDDPEAYMHPPDGPADLSTPGSWSEEERAELTNSFRAVADARLEERSPASRARALRFFLHAVWIGRREILGGVLRARPWEFPYRLNRLTTAAVSTVLIMLMTAEAWDLGMRQPPALVGGLALTALLGTTLFIVKRKRLLGSRGENVRPTEQAVITRSTVTLVVFLGMTVSYACFFLLALGIERVLFDPALARDWAASLESEIRGRHYVVLAGFVSTLGILMGSLGASFEGQSYFLHVTYVDEET